MSVSFSQISSKPPRRFQAQTLSRTANMFSLEMSVLLILIIISMATFGRKLVSQTRSISSRMSRSSQFFTAFFKKSLAGIVFKKFRVKLKIKCNPVRNYHASIINYGNHKSAPPPLLAFAVYTTILSQIINDLVSILPPEAVGEGLVRDISDFNHLDSILTNNFPKRQYFFAKPLSKELW